MTDNVLVIPGQTVVAFIFEGIGLKESCWINAKPYFTARAIGEWLDYAHPQRRIWDIVSKNPHIKEFATILKLRIVEGGREVFREVEVYDPIGLQLIMNKSNQPKAIAFQIAAAHLVITYLKGELTPSKWSLRGDLLSAARQILSLPDGPKRGALVKDLAEREHISTQTVYRRIPIITGERLKTRKGSPRKTRSDSGSHRRGK